MLSDLIAIAMIVGFAWLFTKCADWKAFADAQREQAYRELDHPMTFNEEHGQ